MPEVCSKKRLWVYKIAGLCALILFFYVTYNFANQMTLLRAKNEVIPHVMFAWESNIPLIPWTIIPYWSENLLYGLAVLLACNLRQLKTLLKQLFSVQIICVLGFLLVPLQQINITLRPEIGGFFGWWFDELMKFDLPYNQAPSLHISLLVILWVFYNKIVPRRWQWLMHIWALLIGVSVLTTWQHHFIDIPAGVLAGSLAIWCFPADRKSPLNQLWQKKPYRWPCRWKWALLYFGISALALSIALWLQSIYLWLLYISFSFLLVSFNYAIFGKNGFPKESNGRYQLTNGILFFPYILVAKLNARIWTRDNQAYDRVIEGLYLGAMPRKQAGITEFSSAVDCCVEIPFSLEVAHYYPNYCLDMTALSVQECRDSAMTIHQALRQGKTFVFCALGYSRSATAIASYLMIYENHTLEMALQLILQSRKGVVISVYQQRLLKELEMIGL
ncbi:phosphatase PAP2/dual specificity phosphatase family protein [Ignatzschineria sp. LJL83]